MILDEFVEIKINARHAKYWREKNYNFPPVGGYCGCNGIQKLTVKVSDLAPHSNQEVRCQCPSCDTVVTKRYSRALKNTKCYKCYSSDKMKGNTLGGASKGKKFPHLSGPNSSRWNPNLTEKRRYWNKVRTLSEQNYEKHIDLINPKRLPRTRCGVPGGYQLDHRKSVSQCFETNVPIEECADITNLQLLPWEDNLSKSHK